MKKSIAVSATSPQRGSFFVAILGIVACGVAGSLVAWSAVTALGIAGVMGGIVAAFIAMIVAFALWAGGTAVLHQCHRGRAP